MKLPLRREMLATPTASMLIELKSIAPVENARSLIVQGTTGLEDSKGRDIAAAIDTTTDGNCTICHE